MKLLVEILIICLFIAMVTSTINPGATLIGPDEPGTVLKGPSSKATIKGPSGPIISTAGDTGSVVSAKKAGGVISASPESSGYIAPVIAPATKPLVYHMQAPIPLKDTGKILEDYGKLVY